MIRPAAFGYNAETAANNFFQNNIRADNTELQQKALAEFDTMVEQLRSHSIDVLVIDDTPEPAKPDAIFPNNWLSTSPEGNVFIYPLYAPSRRREKRDDILKLIAEKYVVNNVQDWSEYEAEERYLEGTGSMVIDHANKMIYAAISERTSMAVLEKYAAANGFQAIVFLATDKNGMPVYHTNVVMALGDAFCILCEEAIEEEWELIAVRQLLQSTQHTIIPITRDQMHAFAGNMLQIQNASGEKFIVLSNTAHQSLRNDQLVSLQSFGKLLIIDIPVIEKVEGGSVRCMMAEVFLKNR